MTVRSHGTRVRYVLDKCRCIPCTDANRDYMRELEAERKQPWRVRAIGGGTKGAGPSYYRVEHTTTRAVEATNLSLEEAYELRDHLNATAHLDGEEPEGPRLATWQTMRAVRRHLRALQAAGVGLRQVSRLSGVSRTRLTETMNGTSYHAHRPRNRRLRKATAERILAVTTRPAAHALVDAEETWRLISEMLSAGATRRRIARELGSTAKEPALRIGRDQILAKTADAIRNLHDRFFIGSARMRLACRCEEMHGRDPDRERERLNKQRSRERQQKERSA